MTEAGCKVVPDCNNSCGADTAGDITSSVVAFWPRTVSEATSSSDRNVSGTAGVVTTVVRTSGSSWDTDFVESLPKTDAAAIEDAGIAATEAESEPGVETAGVEFRCVAAC